MTLIKCEEEISLYMINRIRNPYIVIYIYIEVLLNIIFLTLEDAQGSVLLLTTLIMLITVTCLVLK